MTSLSVPRDAVIYELMISDGASVAANTPILRYMYPKPEGMRQAGGYSYFREVEMDGGQLGIVETVVADSDGKVKVLATVGQSVRRGTVVAKIEPQCAHEVVFGGMCVQCGQDVTQQDTRDHQMVSHTTTAFTISTSLARDVHREEAEKLRANRKLSLILDLDMTLIHATCDPAVGAWMASEEQKGSADLLKVVFQFVPSVSPGNVLTLWQDLYRFTLPGDKEKWTYYMKLRPGVRQFLEAVHQRYELHVYTMGVREYADKVTQILDPDLRMFAERILSRNESGDERKKSLDRLFPCDQSMVVVIDDRGDVWDWSPNLIRAFPYTYFVNTKDINAPPGTRAPAAPPPTSGSSSSRLPVKLDEKDRELEFLQAKLIELHDMYYAEYENKSDKADVRVQLPRLKHRVLGGCRIMFSGLLDTKVDRTKTDLYQLLINYGAKYLDEVSSRLTHIIGDPARAQTAKILQARKYPNVAVVSVSWVYDSIAQWRRQDETPYLIVPRRTSLTSSVLDDDDADLDNEEDNVSLRSTVGDSGLSSSSAGEESDEGEGSEEEADATANKELLRQELDYLAASGNSVSGAVNVLAGLESELQAELDELLASDDGEEEEADDSASLPGESQDDGRQDGKEFAKMPGKASEQTEADIWSRALQEEEEEEEDELLKPTSALDKLKRKRPPSPARLSSTSTEEPSKRLRPSSPRTHPEHTMLSSEDVDASSDFGDLEAALEEEWED